MKRQYLCRAVAVGVLLLTASRTIRAEDLVVTPETPGGIFQLGEPVRWKVQWQGDEQPTEVSYTLKKGGLKEFGKGTVELTEGAGVIEATLDEPGTLLVKVSAKTAGRTSRVVYAGAAVAPERIEPSAARPDDFDAFWDEKLKELAAVPANPQLEQAESGRPGVDYWKVTLDNVRDTHIHGQLARPTEGEKFPALLIPQWAGVYPLEKSWATDWARQGWLVLNIFAHDLPIDEPKEFYREQTRGPLKDYEAIGNDDRDTSYFLRMYLSCVQAAEYLMSRPDWDGKILVVSGGSQGGLQAIITAALCPKVTAVTAVVPAGCEMLGPDVGRDPGWPKWYYKVRGKEAQKVREASRYYDVVNFAPRVKCPVIIGLGLIDQVCPPAGIFAAANQLGGPKEVVVMPPAGHEESRGSHRPYYRRSDAWMRDLKAGRPVSIAAAAEPANDSTSYLEPTAENYRKLAGEVETALQQDVLDVWFPRSIDEDHGGFYSNFDRTWKRTNSEGKFSVFQSRMTWITAQVAMRRRELREQFLPYSRHGVMFLNDVMWDAQDGGTFWGLGDDGKPNASFGNDKQLYGIGFCMYAAAGSHAATKDPAALDLAQRIFRWIEEHAHDETNGGYFEWLKRDGTPIPLSEGAKQPVLRFGLPVGGKSMNAHIHILEALAQLYTVWPDETVRKRLEETLLVVRDKICREPGVMPLYFTNDWQPTAERDSYGHDIETAYLLLEAAEALGTASDPKTQRMARMLVDHTLEVGWDKQYGGIYKEGPLVGEPDDLLKDWWPQVEGLNALLMMHELYGNETDKYFKAFQDQWRFIQKFQIDHRYHGVIETVKRDGTPVNKPKGRIWKAAYHDGRAFLNVSDRLRGLAGDGVTPK